MQFNAFQKLAFTTVAATLFLIFVGGLVRGTGSGMGCPDWPKCFGQYIPPTEVSELPENYKELYVQQRVEKNERIVGYLEKAGFNELAYTIANDPNILREEDFNATKTWIEYINRLIGAVIGLLVFATFLRSLSYWKTRRSIPVLAAFVVILTGFQGWLGSIVVSTNLLPGMITTHMILAMVIVNALLFIAVWATKEQFSTYLTPQNRKALLWIAVPLFACIIIQMVLGTQVREAVDIIKEGVNVPPRSTWISQLGEVFPIHRSFSWSIVILNIAFLVLIQRRVASGMLIKQSYTMTALIVLQVSIGAGLNYLNMAAALQVLHLTFGALLICSSFLVLLSLWMSKESVSEGSTISREAHSEIPSFP
ncbi:MAG: COX15/CtaA family protein [Bacteroidota bacterium]